MKNIKSVLFTVAALGLTTGCGGGSGGGSSSSGSLTGTTNSIYAGIWKDPTINCVSTSDSTLPRFNLQTAFTDSSLQTTFTYYTDGTCLSPAVLYKMNSAYTIGAAASGGVGNNVDSHVTSQVVTVTTSSMASYLNTRNSGNSSCGVTFVVGDNDTTNKNCNLTSTGFSTQMDQQTFSIVNVDQSVSPIRMYSGTSSSGHNGLSITQRHVTYSTSYVQKQ